jgi:hypothetical protein
MKLFRYPFGSFCAVAMVSAMALGWAGCQQVFRPKHRVIVDAIVAPGVTKPDGKSYTLVAKRAVVSNMPVQISVLKACMDAALASHGMYEAPPNVPPEIVIDVSYGRDASPRALASVRETYLQLSARANPLRSLNKATGAELWDVRTSVLGISGSIETALPLLSAVAAEHMATNTGMEVKVEVPHNSPLVETVRLAALKTLESQAQKIAAAQGITTAGGGTSARPITPPPPKPVIEPLPVPPEEKPADDDAPPAQARFRTGAETPPPPEK